MNLLELDKKMKMKFKLPKKVTFYNCLKKYLSLYQNNPITNDEEVVDLFVKEYIMKNFIFAYSNFKYENKLDEIKAITNKALNESKKYFEIIDEKQFFEYLKDNKDGKIKNRITEIENYNSQNEEGKNIKIKNMKRIYEERYNENISIINNIKRKELEIDGRMIYFILDIDKLCNDIFLDSVLKKFNIFTKKLLNKNGEETNKILMFISYAEERTKKNKSGNTVFEKVDFLNFNNRYDKHCSISKIDASYFCHENFLNYGNLISMLQDFFNGTELEKEIIFMSLVIISFLPKNCFIKNSTAENVEFFLLQYFPDIVTQIMEKFILESVKAKAIKQEEKYEKQMKKLYGMVFNEKLSNNKLGKTLSQNSPFNNYFNNFEIDATDRVLQNEVYKFKEDKFHILEQAFPTVATTLPTCNKSLDFRIRKLGHYHASGLFFPNINCLCVDVADTSSFIHEFGHYLDFNYSDKQLSMQDSFLKFVGIYTSQLSKTSLETSKLDYFTTPTEVFARCFEIYYYYNYHDMPEMSLFCLNENQLNQIEYQPILKNKEQVFNFLEETFKK